MMTTQASATPLLPAWLADAPPWLQAIALVTSLAGILTPVFLVVYSRRASSTTPNPTPAAIASSAGPAESSMTSSAPAVARVDATVALLDRMVTNLQISHDEAEKEAAGLRSALAEAERREAALKAQLETYQELLDQARREIDRLRWERDQFWRMGPPRPPTPGPSQ
ncbi:hypothetical protein GCM10009613_61320 [Pseudonocardia kongjuensis]|uniref:Uncharacterized protein n=1 Tax=Pseudonocardia kongjuensis TaxID=102227 RepID=A0ABN1YA41_9PSEU